MEGLPRSEVSFRRSGSSGLVWDDKLLSGELKPINTEDRDKTEQQKPEPKPFKTVEIEPTLVDPPSPKVNGGCAAICGMFGKPAKSTQIQKKKVNRKS